MNSYKEIIIQRIISLKKNGAFHIVVGSFLTKFVSFFGSIFIVRFLSKADYGILGYYENFMGYFIVLVGHGLDTATLRYIVLEEDMPGKKGCYLHALKNGSLWNAALLAVSLLVVFFYPHKAAFQGQFLTGALLMLCIPAVFLQRVSLFSLRGLYENRLYALIAFAAAAIQIVSRVVGAAAGGLHTTAGARLIAETVCGLACVAFMRKGRFSSVRSRELEKGTRHDMDVYSFQIMLTNGLWAIFMLNDVFLLGQFTGNEELVADYKIAYVIPANLSILVSAVGIFVAPYFTRYDKEKNYAWIRSKLRLVLAVTTAVMGIVVLLCFIFAKPLILLLFGEQYLSAVPIMRMLLIASLFNNGVRSTIANILSAVGEQKRNLIVAGVGMAIQVTLDCLLIPRYGGMGVAFSSMFVYIFMSAALCVVVWNRYYSKKTIDAQS